MKSLFDFLKQRGFIAGCTDDQLPAMLERGKLTIYSGFDPTADSLHLGHLVPLMMLAHLQRAGHKVITIVGGFTAMIGDPSGRSAERNLLDMDAVSQNAKGIARQLGRFVRMDGDNAALCLDNRDWLQQDLITFLRETGKHFRMGVMLSKDSVKNRLDSDDGMSFTEFTYQILQASDFLHLFDKHGCTLQCGGSDQWGNITAGIELIRKKRGAQAFGITCPLITTAEGEKFGKSAGNAVWLDAKRTSPWEFFQFFVRQADADVVKLLKLFTFLSDEDIAGLEQAVATNPAAREAQRKLAHAVTTLVHGADVAAEMQRAAEVMFRGPIEGLSEETLEMIFASVPSTAVTAAELAAGIPLSTLLVKTGLSASNTKARQLITSGGANVNNVKVTTDVRVSNEHLVSKRHVVLRTGKANFHLLRVQ